MTRTINIIAKPVIFLLFAVCTFISPASAQEKIEIKTTSPSPSASFVQELGSTIIKVEYSRPLARGRQIFGDLVPYDKMWRTGASGSTILETNEDILFGNQNLKAGKYSLFTIPSKTEWTIILNTDTTLHGDSGYNEKKDVMRFKVPAGVAPSFYETFTIEVNDINSKGEGFLKLAWENNVVKIPIKSMADDHIMSLIAKHVISQKAQDANLLFQAANYYFSTNRDAATAVVWLNEAERLDTQNFYYPNLRHKLLASMNDFPNAIKAAEKAIAIAEAKKMKGNLQSLQKSIADYQARLKN